MNTIFYFLRRYVIPKSVFEFFQPAYHATLALLGAIIYRFPSRGVAVIGVTGTNGKSTVVEMLHEMFSGANIKVASLSSVRFKIGKEEIENHFKMTMPGRFFIQKFLRDAKNAGVTHIVLEVTSEGIKQFRHRYINFAAAVLTNLTPEHIESHRGFENYKKAKGKLFALLGPSGASIVNLLDKHADYFLSFSAKKRIGYSLGTGDRGQGTGLGRVVIPAKYEINKNGIRLYFAEGWEVFTTLKGKFNAENMLAAIAVGEEFGISHETMRQVFKNFRGVPGRLEEIKANNFSVVVDYAFTPNALRQVYETLLGDRGQGTANNRMGSQSLSHNLYPPSPRLICVLGGTGGGRDRWKRPELGKIAGEYCAEVIITNEDPYDENPRSIMEEVRRGVEMRNTHFEIIEDRRLAIRDALEGARPGDTVVITGKGSESLMVLAHGRTIAWDDRKVVREELERIKGLSHT